MYYAYIYSKIQYGIEIYGLASSSQIKKIQTIQNKSLKILFNKDYLTPTLSLHKDLNLLLVNDIHKLSLLKFVKKHQQNELPQIFNNYFITNNNIHSHFTRQHKALHVTLNQTRNNSKNFTHSSISSWNEIPSAIKTSKTLNTFSKRTKHYFIDKY